MRLIVIHSKVRERVGGIWVVRSSFISVECIGLHCLSPPHLFLGERKKSNILSLIWAFRSSVKRSTAFGGSCIAKCCADKDDI